MSNKQFNEFLKNNSLKRCKRCGCEPTIDTEYTDSWEYCVGFMYLKCDCGEIDYRLINFKSYDNKQYPTKTPIPSEEAYIELIQNWNSGVYDCEV